MNKPHYRGRNATYRMQVAVKRQISLRPPLPFEDAPDPLPPINPATQETIRVPVCNASTVFDAYPIADEVAKAAGWGDDYRYRVLTTGGLLLVREKYTVKERVPVSREWEDLNCDGYGMTISDADDCF